LKLGPSFDIEIAAADEISKLCDVNPNRTD